MDRTALTPSLVSRLVATQFPAWAGLPVLPVELAGWDNVTFRLGTDMSVRLPAGPAYALQVAKEHQWLPVLARQLPLPVPQPLALGKPGCGYPWPWSVYRWLPGEPAATARITDHRRFAVDLAGFLSALYQADPAGGPPPGEHNFFRGGPLTVYDGQTQAAIAALGGEIDTAAARQVWAAALGAAWQGPPVWVHGDVAAGNLLAERGRLSAVIDFGSSAVGDPACDVTIAWTFFSGESRAAFRALLPADRGVWARGRGWALWKAMIVLVDSLQTGDDAAAAQCRRVIAGVLAADGSQPGIR